MRIGSRFPAIFFALVVVCSSETAVFGQVLASPISLSALLTESLEPMPFRSEIPQYPVQFLGVVGSTYLYQTDCCLPDAHGGLLYSDVFFSPGGCGVGGPLGGENLPPIPPYTAAEFKSFLTTTDVQKKLQFAFSDLSFNRLPKYPFLYAESNRNVGNFRGYYRPDELYHTVVELYDSDGDTGYFSLIRVEVDSFDSNGVAIKQSFPMLILQRSAKDFDSLRKNGTTKNETPDFEIEDVQVDKDSSGKTINLIENAIHRVTIKIPKSETGTDTENVDVLLVIRKGR